MKQLLISITLLLAIWSPAQSLEGIDLQHIADLEALRLASVKDPFDGSRPQRILLSTGVELEYVETGDTAGIPVILLHGLCDSWHSFDLMLPHLPSSYHVFAITQRGHGRSQRPAAGYRPADFAVDLASFIQQRKLGKAVIVGHSMGAINAMQFAITYPHLARSIVLIGGDPAIAANAGMKEFNDQVKKLETVDTAFMREFQASTIATPIEPAYFQLLVDEGLNTPLWVFQAALQALIDTDLRPQLDRIQCPVLQIWGEEDALFFSRGQEEMQKAIRSVHRVTYPKTGHSVHWQEPEAVAKEICRFIAMLK